VPKLSPKIAASHETIMPIQIPAESKTLEKILPGGLEVWESLTFPKALVPEPTGKRIIKIASRSGGRPNGARLIALHVGESAL
jgi:hypothetical protein